MGRKSSASSNSSILLRSVRSRDGGGRPLLVADAGGVFVRLNAHLPGALAARLDPAVRVRPLPLRAASGSPEKRWSRLFDAVHVRPRQAFRPGDAAPPK